MACRGEHGVRTAMGADLKGALEQMQKVAKTGFCLLVAGMLTAISPSVGASAQGKEKAMSDNSVMKLVDLAWAMTPRKFTAPDGKVIEIDKSKRQEVMVPIDVAREVIRVAYYSAHAERCNLEEEQRANYETLMKRERAKSWTEQQLLFIHELHLFTVMFQNGKLKVVATQDDGREVVPLDDTKKAPKPCTDTERQAVQRSIMNYVSGEPTPASKK